VFRYEANMVRPARKWLEEQGLAVKAEFVTPWGICDLVGASMAPGRVAKRLQLGQRRPVSSPTRAAILLRIPDVESGRAITVAKLARAFAPVIPREIVEQEVDRLVRGKYAVRASRGRLQKRNGWIPIHERLVAVELKLSRVTEAMNQAASNLGFADESYVALPKPLAQRVWHKKERWSSHFDRGIGLIAVSARSCTVLRPAAADREGPEDALRFYCLEKFWPACARGS